MEIKKNMMHLFSEGYISNLKIRNRIILAPMNLGPIMDSYGRVTQRHIDHYRSIAEGGAGLIITGVFKVSISSATHKASLDIRAGKITREEGIALVKEFDGRCADRFVKEYCEFL